MNVESTEKAGGQTAEACCPLMPCEALQKEFKHLKLRWCWFFSWGILLVLCGTAAIAFPAVTLVTSVVSMVVLGICLVIAGIGTIATAFWAGKGSRLMLQLLVGILYLVAGYVITDTPLQSAVTMAAFVAAMFIVVGAFRTVAAVAIRFPHWGWALLNGLVTLLCGVIIYRHFPQAAVWVIGLLVGLELLFHGWAWIMLSLAMKNIPAETP